MPSRITWLDLGMVIDIHDYVLELDQIGLPGISQDKSIDGALHRVINRHQYEGVDDILSLAASYGMAIATGHTFNDANKRTAFTAMDVFLRMNGYQIDMDKSEIIELMVATANSELSHDELTEKIYVHLKTLQK